MRVAVCVCTHVKCLVQLAARGSSPAATGASGAPWIQPFLARQLPAHAPPLPAHPCPHPALLTPPALAASRQVNKSLETEREFAKKLGQQAAATKGELAAAVKAGADLGRQNASLQDDLKASACPLSLPLARSLRCCC